MTRLALLCLLIGCSSSGAGWQPPASPAWQLVGEVRADETTGGNVYVSGTCPPIDLARVRSELMTATRRIDREAPGIRGRCLPWITILITDREAGGRWAGDHAVIGCQGAIAYGAIEHEPGHACAQALGHPAWRTMWHRRGDGSWQSLEP